MARLSLGRRQKPGDDRLTALLAAAKSGDREARESLLRSYLPFVDRVAAGACGRAIGRSDDEFQIALVAMNEAIDAYDGGRGSFIAFAETVMRRRLIDSFRANARTRDLPMTAFEAEDDEGNAVNAVEIGAALAVHAAQEEAGMRALELAEYGAALAHFGLSFERLAKIAPKHADARASAIAIARLIATDPELRQRFTETGTLPQKELLARTRVSRKTLERQRAYMIAIVLLFIGDYPILRGFVERG